MMSGRTSKYPFTPSQWQELEHQALIYNYMVSGVPVPPDLIHPMRRSFLLDSTAFTSPSLALPPQPSSKFLCLLQMGFGRKPDDPEPGRCRRTDGKKWRCSKEAHPDSNYCERHMHRGKNRSRKPVEMSLAAAGRRATPASTANSLTSSSLPISLYPPPSFSISTPEVYHRLMYPYSPVKRPQHAAPTYFQLDRESYSSSDKDSSAVKDIDAYCFRSEAAGGERGILQFRPLEMNTLEQNIYSHCTTDLGKERQQEKQQQQHCFVLGEDFKLEKPMKVVDTEKETRPFRHFIDEWPQANKSSWTSMEGEHANLSFTKTQLSISTPMARHN